MQYREIYFFINLNNNVILQKLCLQILMLLLRLFNEEVSYKDYELN